MKINKVYIYRLKRQTKTIRVDGKRYIHLYNLIKSLPAIVRNRMIEEQISTVILNTASTCPFIIIRSTQWVSINLFKRLPC